MLLFTRNPTTKASKTQLGLHFKQTRRNKRFFLSFGHLCLWRNNLMCVFFVGKVYTLVWFIIPCFHSCVVYNSLFSLLTNIKVATLLLRQQLSGQTHYFICKQQFFSALSVEMITSKPKFLN